MKNTVKMALLAALLCCPPTKADAADPFKIHQLGTSNTLVRITNPARYIILPIEEGMPDAKIDVLVNGNVARTFYARLASNQVDYTVPFDLTSYTAAGEVLLNVVMNTRNSSKEASDYICWQELKLDDRFDSSNVEKFRPAYHHTPLYGWMNDPNGMFYKDGVWHLYFQYNPYGSKWQNMTWGHSTSTDLMHWTQQPNAIEPNGLGSVFSGSAVVDHQNTAGFGKEEVIAIYTSAGSSQIQSLAHSGDNGQTFTLYPGNPIITTKQEARDPNMFWNEETGKWNLVLASAQDRDVLIYSSPDLKEWTLESAFGRGYGNQVGVWECPDLIKLPVRGTNQQKWVLICNINPGGIFGGSATQYFVGDFDGHRFTCDTAADETLWMDYGKDHYATVTWSNAPAGRHTAIAWMSNWQYANEVPTMQYRSANTLPRDLDLFRAPDGKLRLGVKPAPEVESLRGTRQTYRPAALSNDGKEYQLPADGICEIDLGLSFQKAQQVEVVLSNDRNEKVVMVYNVGGATKNFVMDRQESGDTHFSKDFATTTEAPLPSNGKKGTLRLFIDRCSIEAFDGEGRFAMTNLVFPSAPYTKLTLSARNGNARMEHLEIYPLNPEKQ